MLTTACYNSVAPKVSSDMGGRVGRPSRRLGQRVRSSTSTRRVAGFRRSASSRTEPRPPPQPQSPPKSPYRPRDTIGPLNLLDFLDRQLSKLGEDNGYLVRITVFLLVMLTA